MSSFIRPMLLSASLLLLGCGDDRTIPTGQHDGGSGLTDSCCADGSDPDQVSSCPATQPTHGDSCSVVNKPCTYTQGCPCGPPAISWSCHCSGGAWDCAPSGQCATCDFGPPDCGPPDYGPDISRCPPLPACNWCGGQHVKDSSGCTVGYVCANGANPCGTQPCYQDSDCPPTHVCESDQLCWLALDAGAP